jgi:hypothetical protein
MTEPVTPQEAGPEPDQERLWESPPGGADPDADPDAVGVAADKPTASPTSRTSRSGRPAAAWTQSLTSPAPQAGPAGLWFADLPDRIIAFVLDVIALAVVGMILAIVVGGAFGGLVSGGSTVGGSLDAAGGSLNLGAFLVVAIVATAVSFAYFGYSWVVLRATPGMRLLGMRIGDQRDGHAISWDQALVRWLLLGIAATLVTFVVYVPDLVGLVLALLGLAWLIVVLVSVSRSPTTQGFHDRRARTILFRAPRRAA